MSSPSEAYFLLSRERILVHGTGALAGPPRPRTSLTASDLTPAKLSRLSARFPHPPLSDPEDPRFKTFPSLFPGGSLTSHHPRKDAARLFPLRSGSGGHSRPRRQEAGQVAPEVPRPRRGTPSPGSRPRAAPADGPPASPRTLARARRQRRPPPPHGARTPASVSGPCTLRASAVVSGHQRCPDPVSSGGPRPQTPTALLRPRPPARPATPPTLTAAALAAAAVFVHLEAAPAAGEPETRGRGAAGGGRR